MCLLRVALRSSALMLSVIGATPLRLEDSDELCAQLLRIDDACEDQWIQHKCEGKTAVHSKNTTGTNHHANNLAMNTIAGTQAATGMIQAPSPSGSAWPPSTRTLTP